MKTPRDLITLATIALLFAVFSALPVVAQDEPTAGDVEVGDEEVATPRVDVDKILGEDDDVSAGRGYGYEAEGRRDPFRSLALVRSDSAADRGPRPDGIPGLLIGELELTGVFVLPEGPVAQVQTSDRDRSYLLRSGDSLFDGDVMSVSLGEIVFRQILDDPTALTPFKEVVKRLNP